MDLPIDAHDIEYAENFLVTGDLATAVPLLEKLVQMLEEYVEAECSDTSKTQWFSFADPFERLAYRRIERDRASWCRWRRRSTASMAPWASPTFASSSGNPLATPLCRPCVGIP